MKVITFGELMLRLAPQGNLRFSQADLFQATYGGGEANVAVSLCNYGIEAAFVTKLPLHEIGQAAVNDLRRYGVDTTLITRGGDRVGIYFLEKGASQRASTVIYDRAYSSISEATMDDFNFEAIFEGVDWFHFTGITPALSASMARITQKACRIAKEKGVKISCDLNYRKKLWSKEKANQVMRTVMPYVDVCIANEEDAANVFGIHAQHTSVENGDLHHDGYVSVAKQLQEEFGCSHVAITLRSSKSADDNDWAAMLYTNGKAHFSTTYPLHIIDRVGGGDSFGGGLIYALLKEYDPSKAIAFATAASCLKHSIEGDYNRVSVKEVEALMSGDGSGRVQR